MIIAAVAILSFTNALQASFGAKAGANLSNIVGDDDSEDFKTKTV